MRSIPITAAAQVAQAWGYDQVVIIARRVEAGAGEPHGEHVTTYGITVEHCAVAARIGNHFKHNLMGWPVAGCRLMLEEDL